MKFILASFFMCLIFQTHLSYGSTFNKISTNSGLSNRRVFMSIKDSDGYVWFATRSGIDRYNGKNFKTFNLSCSNTDGIEYPRGVFLDKSKSVFAYSEKHVYKFSIETNRFECLSNINIPLNETITTASSDPNGNLWIGTTNHLFCTTENDTILKDIKQKVAVFSIIFENKNHGWVGTSKGIYQLVKSADGSFQPKRDKSLSEFNNKRIQTLFYDSLTHYLWIGTFSNGIYRYNKPQKKLYDSHEPTQVLPIRSITNIGTDRIWVGIDGGGIEEYNRFDGNKTEVYSQQNRKNHIDVNNIYHILDNEHSVWICTYTDGVFVYNKSKMITSIYQKIDYNSHSLINNHVNAILEDSKNRIWFATNQGVSRFNPSTQEWKHFLTQNTPSNEITLSLFEDKLGNMWISGYSCDISYIDRNDKLHTPNIPSIPTSPNRKHYVFDIYQDDAGNIWIGGIINNFIQYNPTTKEVKKYNIKGINQILAYNNDTLILASNSGVFFFNKETEKYAPIRIKDKNSLLNINIQKICFTPNDNEELWIGTEGKGVIRYNIKTKEWRQHTQSNGVTSNSICGLQFDNHERLWISTENGLNCLNPKTGHIKTFYEPDGLLNNTQNLRSHCLLRSGNIIWGTPLGAFEIDPNECLWEKEPEHNLRFEEFALFNVPISPGTENSPLNTIIDKTKYIELKHNQHSFSFRFLNVDYINSSKNLYSWYLEGFDKEWTVPSENYQAVYTNIPSGEYKFHVKVLNGGDDLHHQERVLTLKILQPWWNKWWAWVIYIILAAIIVYYIIRIYKERLEAIDSDQKIRFFINIAHDIRTPLTLVKAPLSEIENEPLSDNGRNILLLAQRNIDKLLNMVTQLLDFQKIEREAMSLQIEETDIESFLKNTFNNFEPLIRKKEINLHVNLSDIHELKGYIDRRKISIILDNLISNSIKYTPQYGNIWVIAKALNGKLNIEITDDGIGIAAKDQKKLFNRFYRAENAVNSNETGSGIGLLLTKKMTHLHKGEINFSSTIGVGTTFNISIPILKNNYSKEDIIIKEFSTQNEKDQIELIQDCDKKIKLMIVEDNEELRMYISHYLRSNYHIIESCDGQEAIEMIHKESPDFIISDIMMPNLSGIELCKHLKSNIETCHIPIILLTSLSEREDIIKGLNAGADDYITKPFELPVLKAKISSIINNRKLFRKKYIDKSLFNEDSTSINTLDKKFMSQVIDYVEEKMVNDNFNIDNLATEMAMSRSVFFKKIKSLTGQSPQDFIRDIKMKRASSLLLEKKYSIGEIAYLTGYPNSKYFSTAFKKYYGTTPSNYITNNDEIINEEIKIDLSEKEED